MSRLSKRRSVIGISLALVTLIYVLISFVASTALPVEALASTNAPISLLFEELTGLPPLAITLIAIMATMKVTAKYAMSDAEKKWECGKVYMGEGTPTPEEFWKIAKDDHPGVQMVMGQKEVNLAGPVKVLSEGDYPVRYAGVYHRPAESRKIFEDRGWSDVAALQLRNPMHRSHEYLCKIAVEVCDGVYIHSLVGNLKPGDIPAEGSSNNKRSGSVINAMLMASICLCPPLRVRARWFLRSPRIGKVSHAVSIPRCRASLSFEKPPISKFSRMVREGNVLSSCGT